jgi:hypothetical protein
MNRNKLFARRASGDGGQVAWTIYGYESLWLPTSPLEDDSQERLTNALFAGSRYQLIELHFNKGLDSDEPRCVECVCAGDCRGRRRRISGSTRPRAGHRRGAKISPAGSSLHERTAHSGTKGRGVRFGKRFLRRGLAAFVLGQQLCASSISEKEV